jgi:hypothetical protein
LAKRNSPLPEITRQRLQAGKALQNLEWVEGEVRERLQQLDLAEVPALKLYADIQRFKISKCLPDLKAVEHSGTLGIEQTITIKVGG